MLGKEEAANILQELEAVRGNPLAMIEIIKKAGEAGGFNVIELFNKLRTESRPNETIDQTFKRLMTEEKPNNKS